MNLEQAIEVLDKLKEELPKIEKEKYKYTGFSLDSEFVKKFIYDYKKEIEAIETLINTVEGVREVLANAGHAREVNSLGTEYNKLVSKLKNKLGVSE